MNKPKPSKSAKAIVGLLAMACLALHSLPARAADDFTLIKTSIEVHLLLGQRYDPPKAGHSQRNTTWIPHIIFVTRGKAPSGSRCSITFTRPDGIVWLKFPMASEDTDQPGETKYETPTSGDLAAYEKKYLTTGGVFGFKINLHDELASKDETLFSGKFKVNRISRYQATPDTKGDADFYVDHDWTLPIGYIWFQAKYQSDEESPPLRISSWFRGRVDMADMGGYLYYKGKLIGNTKGLGGSMDHNLLHGTSEGKPADPRWELWDFCYSNVRKTVPGAADNPNLFALDKNPGDYEFKVLRKGQLCRDIKFTVGDDGKIADNGIATANKMGTHRIIVPVKVTGTGDGAWRQTAWKTEAFYGNPLTGFTAP